MLRGNLASRPFYNERLASLVLVVVAVGVALLTAFNIGSLNRLWGERTRLEGEIQRDESEAARVLADVDVSAQQVGPVARARLAYGAEEANGLIDRRTFSWTLFFDIMEDALPFDVRLVSVAHRLEEEGLLLVLTVVARNDRDLNTLVTGMLGTGQFLDVLPTEKMRNDDGSVTSLIETWYVPLQTSPSDAVETASTPGGRP